MLHWILILVVDGYISSCFAKKFASAKFYTPVPNLVEKPRIVWGLLLVFTLSNISREENAFAKKWAWGVQSRANTSFLSFLLAGRVTKGGPNISPLGNLSAAAKNCLPWRSLPSQAAYWMRAMMNSQLLTPSIHITCFLIEISRASPFWVAFSR